MKMMKSSFFVCLSLFILFSLFTPIFAVADEYNNRLTNINIYQKELGAWDLKGTITNSTYSEGMNISVIADEKLGFSVTHYLNRTLANLWYDVENTSAIGIQIFQTSTFAEPMTTIITDEFLPMNEWTLNSYDYDIDYSISTLAVCNITHWINYHNGSDWLLIEEFIFNLVEESGSGYTPPTYTNIYDFRFIWFWGMVVSIFLSPMLFAIAIKNLSINATIFGIVTVCCVIGFYLLLSVG